MTERVEKAMGALDRARQLRDATKKLLAYREKKLLEAQWCVGETIAEEIKNETSR